MHVSLQLANMDRRVQVCLLSCPSLTQHLALERWQPTRDPAGIKLTESSSFPDTADVPCTSAKADLSQALNHEKHNVLVVLNHDNTSHSR